MSGNPATLSRFSRQFLETNAPEGLEDLTRSEAQDEPLGTWWERHHREETEVWRSPGTLGAEIWPRLGVSPRRGDVVLNIGVGSGQCTRDLHAAGCEVHAMDISPTALERVGDVARLYRPGAPLPPLDLALSHLVAQHMLDADLQAQISHVIGALKPGGVFAIQFAVSTDACMDTRASAKGGGVTRTHEHMTALAEAAGARVAAILERESFPQYGASWSVVQLTAPDDR